jgi:pimeloyl-ACP methyl ester carboxylesterase
VATAPRGDGDPAPPPGAASAPAERPWTALGPADAPGIVFLHGTRLTRAQWLPQLRALSRSFRCVAVDLPGHGALGGEPFTHERAVEVVIRAIDAEIPAGRAVVVGLSLGGYVGIETAEASPERVAGLVLAGCSAEPVGPATAPFRLFRWFLVRAPRRAQQVANRTFFRVRYRRATAEPIIEAGFWAAGGAAALGEVLGRRYLDRLARLWTPVLVVNGALDPVFGPSGEYWAASCRRGTHAVIPRAMHLSNLDRPATFSRLVAGFVRRVSRDG